jgi:ABC-type transport system substrate-binding protein
MIYSNWGHDIAIYDLITARQTLIDASWPGTAGLTANNNVSIGNEWEKLVDDGTPLAIYNFSLIHDEYDHIIRANLISKYLKQIGVEVVYNNLTAQEWSDKLWLGGMEFYTWGWGAAFNDPIEILNPFYLMNATYNFNNFYDPQVQDWLEQGLIETNETVREEIYNNIQKRLVEELYPAVWLYTRVRYHVWASNLKGIPPALFSLKYLYIEEN